MIEIFEPIKMVEPRTETGVTRSPKRKRRDGRKVFKDSRKGTEILHLVKSKEVGYRFTNPRLNRSVPVLHGVVEYPDSFRTFKDRKGKKKKRVPVQTFPSSVCLKMKRDCS